MDRAADVGIQLKSVLRRLGTRINVVGLAMSVRVRLELDRPPRCFGPSAGPVTGFKLVLLDVGCVSPTCACEKSSALLLGKPRKHIRLLLKLTISVSQ